MNRKHIYIRDPFIWVDRENKCYYMYGSTDLKGIGFHTKQRFSVYKSYDLENFERKKVIFDGKKARFWANKDYWASEMHKIGEKYYLFGSVKRDGKCRATQIFVCDTPDGRFVPLSVVARTPENWECLDGTFYEENGKKYMVFCHEWLQVHNGEICAIQLSDDLTKPVGEPVLLFRGGDSPFVRGFSEPENFITDGPFFYKENGKLCMLWSSNSKKTGKYCVLRAVSDGGLFGKWTQEETEWNNECGHAMLFVDLNGKRKIAMHTNNNRHGKERPVFFDY